ncbi:putative restriction endonuclease domain-containing protein [Gammaproteobacteria bacterium]
MSALPKLTPEAYLEYERQSPEKSEYINGETFAMSGASPAHNLIVLNIGAELRNQMKRRPCRVYSSDLRVRVLDGYVYPDLTVVCRRPEFVDRDNLVNPLLIVEVLSPHTADYDQGGKFARYRQIASLREYLLVAQDRCAITQYQWQDQNHWLLTEISTAEAVIHLASIECSLALPEIYDKVFEND